MKLSFRSFMIGALALSGAGLIATSFVPKAHADGWDKMTIVTVHEPIIAGNKVLDPGTYVWKLMDSPADRHVVQIYDKNQQHLEETILAIPDYRLQPTGKTQFAFYETPAGVPKAVKAWFYPGDNYGQEFAYPRKLVAELASARPVPAPAAYRESEPEPQPAPAPQPEAQPAPTAQPVPPPEPQPEPQAQAQQPVPAPASAEPEALPHTASFNPLIGLLGLASLSGAGLLTLATRKA
jgi:hypothetical protein